MTCHFHYGDTLKNSELGSNIYITITNKVVAVVKYENDILLKFRTNVLYQHESSVEVKTGDIIYARNENIKLPTGFRKAN